MKNSKAELGFIVIEDDGGGLTLFVKRGKQVIWAHTGYEYCPGQLIEDLRALWAGADPIEDGWENGEDPQAMHDALRENYWGWGIVATNAYIVLPDYMGAAARAEILDRLTADERARFFEDII